MRNFGFITILLAFVVIAATFLLSVLAATTPRTAGITPAPVSIEIEQMTKAAKTLPVEPHTGMH